MPKYHIEADTDMGTFKYTKDGKDVDHSHMVVSSYKTYDYDNNGEKVNKRRVAISHSHTDEKGVQETHDVAFFLGEPQEPNMMMTPNYGIPQAVAKIVETAIASDKLNKVLAAKKK